MRRFHTSARALKNPFFFYDLQRMQGPAANSQAEDPSFAPGRKTFDPLASQAKESMEARVRKVFGEMASRDESRKEAQAKAVTVAGISVPARPEEPTNCCMSGCINCVWELYKDELDEFRQLRAEARRRLLKPEFNHVKWPPILGTEPPGRGSAATGKVAAEEAHEEAHEDEEDDLNTGIKVFIETERKIKQRKKNLSAEQA